MRTACVIVFAFGSLSTVGAANALVPMSFGKVGSISSPQEVQIAQQGPGKDGQAQRRRQNPRHKTLAPGEEKPASAPESNAIHTHDSDAIQPRLAPGS
jgi:hypothetical protein